MGWSMLQCGQCSEFVIFTVLRTQCAHMWCPQGTLRVGGEGVEDVAHKGHFDANHLLVLGVVLG